MEFRRQDYTSRELSLLELSIGGMVIHEAMDLCGTARTKLDEPRLMDETEKSTVSGMLDGLSINPQPQLIEGIEKLVLPGKIISLGLFTINPVDKDVPISNPSLIGLKRLSESHIYLTAVGRSKHPDDAVSLRNVPLFLRAEDGMIIEPHLTQAGNYKFSVRPGKKYQVEYGPVDEG